MESLVEEITGEKYNFKGVKKMSNEELEQKAEKYANKIKPCDMVYNDNKGMNECRFDLDQFTQAYKDGYKQSGADKNTEIENLKAQIEKMKCCGNCKHQYSFLFDDEIECRNNGLPNWELAE